MSVCKWPCRVFVYPHEPTAVGRFSSRRICHTPCVSCRCRVVIHFSTGTTTTRDTKRWITVEEVGTLKFRCDRDLLSDALQAVQRSVSARGGIPALNGVLLQAVGGTLTLTTTDLEVSAQLTLEVQVTEEGSALVPVRLFADVVRSLAEAPVDFSSDGSQAQIQAAAYEGTLRLLPVEDFPAIQEPSGTKVQVNGGLFALAVSQAGRAASKDEARPVLTGVLLEISREGIILAATDSYRLAVREVTATADGEAKAIVPERALSEAGRAASADEKAEITIVLDDNQVGFYIGNLHLTSRLIEGEFPNYRQLLPDGYENRLTMPRTQLMDAVKRVGLMARDNSPVRLEFNQLGVRLTSQSPDLGKAIEAIEANYEGEEVTIAFNPTFLNDGLAAAVGDTVRLEVRDGMKPGVVHGENDEFTYLVMPVRLPAPVG